MSVNKVESSRPKRKLQKWYFIGDLAADWWWDEDYCFRLLHGKTIWETAAYTSGTQSVRAMRFDVAAGHGRLRYFKRTQQVVLVPK